MTDRIDVPEDVRGWIRHVFDSVSRRVATSMMKAPNTHETALDMTFIEQVQQHSAPVRLPSDWIVRLDTHFLGGRRHFYGWEIADIGVIIQFRKGGKLLRTKILLLQSKRLYPIEQQYEEDIAADYEIGFARLFREDAAFASITQPRTFSFSAEASYKALLVKDDQYEAIRKYEQQYEIPVYYMLYHPAIVPFSVDVPHVVLGEPQSELRVGCRVLPADVLRGFLRKHKKGSTPTYHDLSKRTRKAGVPAFEDPPGWPLSQFIADHGIDCLVGYVTTKKVDSGLDRIFSRRAGPISAAIAITFDAPPG